MPNGFGFNWPGHRDGIGISSAERDPDRARRHRPCNRSAGSGVRAGRGRARQDRRTQRWVKRLIHRRAPRRSEHRDDCSARSGDGTLIIAAALAAIAAAAIAVLAASAHDSSSPEGCSRQVARPPASAASTPSRSRVCGCRSSPLLVGLPILALSMPRAPSTGPSDALATNPYVDPGTRLSGPAPDFTLTDELGQHVSLHAFRGKVVILAFNDSECTTICPLTTTAMLAAKRMLGAAGSQVQLLGVDANPKATALQDVLSYSQLHGMLRDWRFLTGSLSQLKHVWHAYHIEAAIEAGQIAHTPAVYVIDPRGKLARIYTTQQSYASIDQQAQVFADEASALLPSHPRGSLNPHLRPIPTITPADAATPAAGGRRHRPPRPRRTSRLVLFFATWNQQTTSLAGQLETLNRLRRPPPPRRSCPR